MSLAQKLKAEGKAEGIAIGKVQLLERLLKKPASEDSALDRNESG